MPQRTYNPHKPQLFPRTLKQHLSKKLPLGKKRTLKNDNRTLKHEFGLQPKNGARLDFKLALRLVLRRDL